MIPDSYQNRWHQPRLAISRRRVTRAADERRDFEELSERLGATASFRCQPRVGGHPLRSTFGASR